MSSTLRSFGSLPLSRLVHLRESSDATIFNLPWGLLAVLFFGTILSALLFGVTVVQLSVYYRNHSGDRRIHKASVGLLGVIDAATLAFNIAGMWYLTNSLSEPEPLFVNMAFQSQVAVTTMLFSVQQTLYWYRIWNVRQGGRLLPAAIMLCIIIGWGWNIGFALILFDIVPTTEPIVILFLKVIPVITAFNDVAVALTLCYYLHRVRHTNIAWIGFLIDWIFGTGALTSVLSIAVMVTLYTLPGLQTFIALDGVVSKLYVNSFLVMLNARHHDDFSAKKKEGSDVEKFTSNPIPRRARQNTVMITPHTGSSITIQEAFARHRRQYSDRVFDIRKRGSDHSDFRLSDIIPRKITPQPESPAQLQMPICDLTRICPAAKEPVVCADAQICTYTDDLNEAPRSWSRGTPIRRSSRDPPGLTGEDVYCTAV